MGCFTRWKRLSLGKRSLPPSMHLRIILVTTWMGGERGPKPIPDLSTTVETPLPSICCTSTSPATFEDAYGEMGRKLSFSFEG